MLVLVEDAHWIDPTTAEWLEMLVERLARPARLAGGYGATGIRAAAGSGLSHVAVLPLGRLEQEHGTAIMERVAGGKKLPPDIADQILANTEGVPLFVEELTQDGPRFRPAGRGRRSLPADRAAACPGDPLDAAGFADGAARPAVAVKETAQIGACIGRVFRPPAARGGERY